MRAQEGDGRVNVTVAHGMRTQAQLQSGRRPLPDGRPRHRRAGRPRPARGLHRPAAEALAQAVEPGQDPRPRFRRPRARRTADPQSETGPGHHRPPATTASTTAWSATTAAWSQCSTGRSARSAIRSPTSGCCRCTGPARTTPAAPGRLGDTAPGFWTEPTRRALRRGERPRPLAAAVLRVVRGTGSSPASSRGVRPLPRRQRSASGPPAELAPFKLQVEGAAAMALPRLESISMARPARRLHVARDHPHARRPVLVAMLTGWIDASGAAATALGRGRTGVRRPPLAPSTATVHRLPGPAADDGTPRRRQRPTRLARDRAAVPGGPPREVTTCWCRPGTRLGLARFRPVNHRPGGRTGCAEDGVPSGPTRSLRRTP